MAGLQHCICAVQMVWAVSDKGSKRESNQDSYLVNESLGLFVVADGMGGHSGGEVASSLAVQTLENEIKVMKTANLSVKELIQKINIKRYQMMIYYELGYINELYSFIDASKHFITNDNKSSEAVKKTFFNFVSILLKLLNIKSKPSKAIGKYELEALKEEILSSESPNKIWLLEKISDLQTSFHEKL